MCDPAYTLSNLHRSLAAQGLHQWYLDCYWYGSLKAGLEPVLTLILFRPLSPKQLSGTTYIFECRASRLDITSSVPVNTYKPQFKDELLTIIPIGSQAPCFQQEGFFSLPRESIKAFFDNAHQRTSPEDVPDNKLCKAWRHLVELLTAPNTADSLESLTYQGRP